MKLFHSSFKVNSVTCSLLPSDYYVVKFHDSRFSEIHRFYFSTPTIHRGRGRTVFHINRSNWNFQSVIACVPVN